MNPILSARSNNSGAGGLCEVRMALHPIAFRISSCLSRPPSVDRRAQTAEVMVVADAVDLNRLPIQQKSLVRIEDEGTDADRGSVNIHNLAPADHLGDDLVQIGIVDRPEIAA